MLCLVNNNELHLISEYKKSPYWGFLLTSVYFYCSKLQELTNFYGISHAQYRKYLRLDCLMLCNMFLNMKVAVRLTFVFAQLSVLPKYVPRYV